MDLIYFAFLLLFTQHEIVLGQIGSSLLTLSPSTPSITHFENESFIIICHTVQKGIEVKWRDPLGKTRANTKGRVHIERKSGLALVFEHIALSDNGNWTCEATSVDVDPSVRIKSFELLVNQKISFDKTEMVQSAREGRDATVNCFVQGKPSPVISWLFNGEHINTDGSKKYKILHDGLNIKNVTQSDAGEYTCRAMRITPQFSDSDHITILLRIQHKPQWLKNASDPLYAYIGGSVNITCDASGEPPPSFKWIHNGKAIVGQNHRIFYSDNGSILQIQVKNETQFGDYKCKVANPLDNLERVITLRKGPKPATPTRFLLKRVFSNGFEFDIKAPPIPDADDTLQVFGYAIEYMSESHFKYHAGNWSYSKGKFFSLHKGYRFIITILDSNTTYLMRAASRNVAGLSDWTQVKVFTTLSNFANNPAMSSLTWRMYLLFASILIFKNWHPF